MIVKSVGRFVPSPSTQVFVPERVTFGSSFVKLKLYPVVGVSSAVALEHV